MKKKYVLPFMMTGGTPGSGTGGGTNTGGIGETPEPYDPIIKPVPFEDWINSSPKEMDGIDGVTEDDYYLWWVSRGFSKEEWQSVNGSREWPGNDY